jgi:hypothetical protein
VPLYSQSNKNLLSWKATSWRKEVVLVIAKGSIAVSPVEEGAHL